MVKSATNTFNIPARTDIIEGAEDDIELTFQDKLKDAENTFDYIVSGLEQLPETAAEEILLNLDETLDNFVQTIADELIG